MYTWEKVWLWVLSSLLKCLFGLYFHFCADEGSVAVTSCSQSMLPNQFFLFAPSKNRKPSLSRRIFQQRSDRETQLHGEWATS